MGHRSVNGMNRSGSSPRMNKDNPRLSRLQNKPPRRPNTGRWRGLSGRAELERAKAQRYEPYGYESNSVHLKVLVALMALWVLMCLTLVVSTQSTSSLLERWETQGFTQAPPGTMELENMVEFALAHSVDCGSVNAVLSRTSGCAQVERFSMEYEAAVTRDSLLFVGLMAIMIVIAFPFTWFTHRASRNLLTLKSEDQRFSPEWAVGWLFIPVMNLWRPAQVFFELFKASELTQLTQGIPGGWSRNPRSGFVSFWWFSVLVALLFSPFIWGRTLPKSNIMELIQATSTMGWMYLMMVIPAITATAMLYALHQKQQAKFVEVGPNTVTPPRPKLDPLEEELRRLGHGKSESETQSEVDRGS